MKKLVFTMPVLLAFFLISCSSSNSKNEPRKAEKCFTKTSDFSSGMLGKYLDVVTSDLYLVEANSSKSLMAELWISRNNDAPNDFDGVDVRDIYFTRLLSVATIMIEDKYGVKLAELHLKDGDDLIMKKFVNGEEISGHVQFVGEVEDPEDVLERCYNCVPYLTADIENRGKE